ncbi:DHH family phosphoesterase [uncultured Clostridium sp.]|uniref:DHH family phosphoesterase n=1 Tax=uncultured Clostridium sp. TaxID=59620 RepID=UPI00261ED17E|nr:DHH family phosphoesterase [uncultured Clostridium sp.]
MYFKLKRMHLVAIMLIFSLLIIVNLLVSSNLVAGLVVPTVYIIFLSVIVINLLKKQEINDEENKRIAQEIKITIENNILDSVYPAAIIDSSGKLFWFNKVFRELYPDYNLKNNRIVAIVKGIVVEKVLKCDRMTSQKICINDIKYDVYGKSIITEAGEEYCLVNFTDVSTIRDEQKQCVVLVEIDNLKELDAYIDNEEKPTLLADIQRRVNKYANSVGAMVKKYDYDKYILTMLDSEIEKAIENKLYILDITRDISSSIDITLSVGIGRGGETPYENQEFATRAIDLALGRGGDQLVIKTKDDTQIFGGNTNAPEKKNKVRARVIAHALRDLIYESDRVFIIGHKNPDMDCFGSALGMASTVKKLGVKCNIVLNNDTNAINNFLQTVKAKEEYKGLIVDSHYTSNKINDKTLIIVTDVYSESYVANIDLLKRCDRVVIIDHHRKSTDYIKNTILTYLEVYASSTSELVTELIQYMLDRPNLSITEAEGLLAGIFMDTKNFTFKTGVRTFEAAAFLRKMGADTTAVKKIFNNDLESYLARFEVIKSAEVAEGIAISVCPNSLAEVVFAAQGADELINIVGIECAFVFVKVKSKIYLSARSIGGMNVQVIMEALGGGGHRTMAGTQFTDISVEEAKNRLKKALKEYLKNREADE